MKCIKILAVFSTFLFASTGQAQSKSDAVLFDFETGNLNGWEVVGQNPLAGGKPLSKSEVQTWKRGPVGYKGNYYLETGADFGRHTNHPDGTLVSPEFTINKKYLNFYLGGEVNPNVRVYLKVGDKIVREAYGNNFYDLQLRGWDVAAFKNKKARFCLEDNSEMRSLIRLDHIYLSNMAPPAPQEWVKAQDRQRSGLVCPGEFKLIFDNAQLPEKSWKITETSLVYGHDKKWHLYASAYAPGNQWNEDKWTSIIHATTDKLNGGTWKYEGTVLSADPKFNEQFIWDPNVVYHNGQYYMYYVGGGNPWSGWFNAPGGKHNLWHGETSSGDQGPFHVFLATSKDGVNWERRGEDNRQTGKGRIFTDKPFAFDPYVHRVGDQWVMYYASGENETVFGRHAIGYRTSPDLINWSERKHALLDWDAKDAREAAPYQGKTKPASPWPEHSFFRNPAVFKRGNYWYLLTGPVDNDNLSRYHTLRIYRSQDPFKFGNHWEAANTNKRLFVDGNARPIRDTDGKWYITTTNDMSGGVWLAPLHWNDGADDSDTSLPVAGK